VPPQSPRGAWHRGRERRADLRYGACMTIPLPPELEQRVTELAHATRRDPATVLAELVADALDDDEEESLRLRLAESRAQHARGESIEHGDAMDQVRSKLERLGS
jgi:predicted transcriptional regulator